MISIVVFVVTLALVNAVVDYEIIAANGRIRHTLEAAIRGILILIVSSDIYTFIGLCGVFWLVFELTLNRLRGKEWLYVGVTVETDKIFRRAFPECPGVAMLITKLIFITGLFEAYLTALTR